MLRFLRDANYEPHICFECDSDMPNVPLADRLCAAGVEIAYFQKVHGPAVVREVEKVSQRGIRTIFGVCDVIDNEMARACDATIVVSDYLKNLYDPKLQPKIFVVHDGIERPEVERRESSSTRKVEKSLKAVLVTAYAPLEIPIVRTPPKFVEITVVGRYPSSNSFLQKLRDSYWDILKKKNAAQRYRFIKHLLNKEFKTVSWDINSVYRVMAESDVGIIPVDMKHDPLPDQAVSSWQVRSENRLTMKMAIGLPVIASPVPSYHAVIQQGINGYLATDRADWIALFDQLRDPKIRQSIGSNARASVIERFSKESQARKLLTVLETVRRGSLEPFVRQTIETSTI
jgi:glycosyltransferase involved in cell wall biosynthesis